MRAARSVAAGAAATLLALSTVACGALTDDASTGAPDGQDQGGFGLQGGTWTVLMYSIADTDLEPFLMEDIEELAAVSGDPDLHVTALVDRAGEYSDANVLGLGDWEGGALLDLTGPGSADVVAELGDVDTGDPAVLAGFITQGIQNHPADHYALVISDHGASWPGVGGDEGSDYNTLTLADLQSGIAEGLAGAGVEKLDLLGFDACLMATYEVASTMAPLADRMIASQELEPGHGWNYGSFRLAGQGASVDALGAAIIDGFQAQAVDEQTDASITLSLVDLTKMAELDAAMAALSTALVERVDSVAPAVGRTLAQTLGFGKSPDPAYDVHMSDLGILAGELSVDAVDIAAQAEDVVRAINDVVIDRVDGQATQGATGLSIYFPPTSDYYDPAYGDLAVSTGWDDFLATYYTAGSEIPESEQAAFVSGDATIQFADDGVYIAGEFEPAAEGNIASAYVSYGFPTDDGGWAFFGDEDASYVPDGTATITGFFDLTVLTITDGVDTMDAYLSLGYDEDGYFVIDVPMWAQADGDTTGETLTDIILELGVEPESGDIVSEVYYAQQDGTGNYGEWTPPENTLLFPLWLYQDPSGEYYWAPTEGPGLWAELPNLQYNLEKIEPGTEMWFELTAVDYGGNTDTVGAYITIE